MHEEKSAIVSFLNLTADYLKDGHAHTHIVQQEKPALPLVYLVDEEDPYSESLDSSDSSESPDSLETVAEEIAVCKACLLSEKRTLAVPGEGAQSPLVMVIGEGPGADEDRAGRPFVGRAGKLLDKMLEQIGLFRIKNCYIANTVKCRPPGNRDPAHDEMDACYPYLERQILLLKPQFILCVVRVAAQYLLKTSQGINALRGTFTELKIGETVIPVLPTFHPSAVLRDESLKRPVWEDLKLLRSRLIALNPNYGE